MTKSGVHAGEKRPAVADWGVAAKEHLTLGGSILYCNTSEEVFRILIFGNMTPTSGNYTHGDYLQWLAMRMITLTPIAMHKDSFGRNCANLQHK